MWCTFFSNPASMPANSDQYYGLNQFAIQLNGFEEGMKDKLPQTDSRFRPDQRLAFQPPPHTHTQSLYTLQWNLSNLDTLGTEESVLISEVS